MKIFNLIQLRLNIQIWLAYNFINIPFIKGFHIPFDSGKIGFI